MNPRRQMIERLEMRQMLTGPGGAEELWELLEEPINDGPVVIGRASYADRVGIKIAQAPHASNIRLEPIYCTGFQPADDIDPPESFDSMRFWTPCHAVPDNDQPSWGEPDEPGIVPDSEPEKPDVEQVDRMFAGAARIQWRHVDPLERMGIDPHTPKDRHVDPLERVGIDPHTPKDRHVDPLERVGIDPHTPKDRHVDPLEQVGIDPSTPKDPPCEPEVDQEPQPGLADDEISQVHGDDPAGEVPVEDTAPEGPAEYRGPGSQPPPPITDTRAFATQ